MSRLSRDSLCRCVAWWLPQRVVYWAAIRLMSYATIGQYRTTVVPELSALEALRRWEMPDDHCPTYEEKDND